MKELKWDLQDIVLIPAEESAISSRKQCDTNVPFKIPHSILYYNTLPLMCSPMDTVVSKHNYNKFAENGIIFCMPRGIYVNEQINKPYFQSFGLCEIEHQLKYDCPNDLLLVRKFKKSIMFYDCPNILIDIANGHMYKLIDIIKEIKQKYPNIILMVGNVANPDTFINLGLAGADYVRCSIGTGCFISGQNIKLKNENKNIKNINIGDEVLTHLNEYKKVTNKFEYDINEEIYEINDIKCTQNHEFFVIEKQYENIVNDENLLQYAKWISAKDLDINKHLLVQY